MKSIHPFKHVLAPMVALSGLATADWHPLWPGEAPGGNKSATLTENTGEGGSLSHITTPQYELHLPDPAKGTGSTVIVLPGGGYSILAMEHEGREYARWLNERGILAMVVKYRVSDDDRAGYQFPVPLMDARRAIRLARSKAGEWGVDAHRIGVMGSSAGGHLASMCATMWQDELPGETADAIDALECRPDFAVLVYPVITMSEKWLHAGSRRRLLGEHPDRALAARLSSEMRVSEKTPPCFLVHAADDQGVPARNSLEFAARCTENHVPVVCHIFSCGGHGFGLHGRGDSAAWPGLLENWLRDRSP